MKQFFDSHHYKAAKLNSILPKSLVAGLLILAAIIVLASLFLQEYLSNAGLEGWLRLSSSIFLASALYWLFVTYLESGPPQLEWPITLAASRLLYKSYSRGNVSVYKLLDAAASDSNVNWMLRHLGIPAAELHKFARTKSHDIQTIDGLLKLAKVMVGNRDVDAGDLINVLIKSDSLVEEFFFKYDVKADDVSEAWAWRRRLIETRAAESKFWATENLLNIKGVGKDWSAGWTRSLEDASRDLTQEASIHKHAPHLYGHREYVEQIGRGLVEGMRNVVLVGWPGVGRHTILRALAQTMNNGTTYGPIRYQRLLQLDPATLLMHSENKTPLERIKEVLGEALAVGNVVLVINNIDALFDDSPEVGRINATEAILPFFKSNLRVIGISNPPNYQKTIDRNPELGRFFTKIEITEATPPQVLSILEDEAAHIEARSPIVFSLAALREIVNLAGRLIQNLPNPEKSLEVLNETAAFVVAKTQDRFVTPAHVQNVISERTHVPVGSLGEKEKDLLMNLEEFLHRRIIGQERAIKEISDALRRSRSAVGDIEKPIGSFLFLGPTGVGKTETTKALAAIYFGNENRIIRLDMSEFQEASSIDRLIGSATQRVGGQLTDAIMASPFSIVLLDEIEKAHPKILDLFLQVLDEGRLTDAMGRTASFDNAMIIATSNAGSEFIREQVSAGKVVAKDALTDYLMKQALFRPEFLNRFDGIVAFEPLSKEQLHKVAELIIKALNKRLEDKEVQVSATPELLDYIVTQAYKPEFGARPLKRFVQDTVENYVAKGLIDGTIKRGDRLNLKPEVLLP